MIPRMMFSPDRVYRYTLWRETGIHNELYAMFIGLNPSTADETLDDPTIRRCVAFARSWGYGRLCMTNLFALRSRDPKMMKKHPSPIGPDNDFHLWECGKKASVIIAAWGNHGIHMNRDKTMRTIFSGLHFLQINSKSGQPAHPLYLPSNLTPQEWR